MAGDELLGFREATLQYEVSVVGFALRDLVVDRMSPRLRSGFDCFVLFLGTIFIALVMWTSTNYALQVTSETTNIFQITRLPFRLIFAFGCIVLFLVLAGQFVESLVKMVKKWTP